MLLCFLERLLESLILQQIINFQLPTGIFPLLLCFQMLTLTVIVEL